MREIEESKRERKKEIRSQDFYLYTLSKHCTYLVSGVLEPSPYDPRVVQIFLHPRQTWTASIDEHVLAPRVAVIVTVDLLQRQNTLTHITTANNLNNEISFKAYVI